MSLNPVMQAEEIETYLAKIFPQAVSSKKTIFIEKLEPGRIVIRKETSDRDLRPGGTISGPTLFALADLSAYFVILAHIGPVALAVTTNLNINFLRKPEPGTLISDCKILKLGKRLCIVEVSIYSNGNDDPVAHATATYSIPPK